MDSRIRKGKGKLYMELINRLKNRQLIPHDNRALSLELSSISDPLMRLLVQVESYNHKKFDQGQFQQFQNKVELQSKTVDRQSELMNTYRLMILKMKVFTLVGLLAEGDMNHLTVCISKLVGFIDSWQQYSYVLRLMFRVNSLRQLEQINIGRIIEDNLSETEKEQLYYIIGLVKTQSRPDEARKIFETKLVNYLYQDVVIEKRNLLKIIRTLLQKQKDLQHKRREERAELQQSTILAHSQLKENLKDKIQQLYNIDLEQSERSNKQPIQSLPDKEYPIAAPLYRLFYEKHPEVIEKISDTTLYNKLHSVEYVLPSTISATVSHLPLTTASKAQKLKNSTLKNYDLFKSYLQKSSDLCGSKYMLFARQGLDVTKHNFGNSSTLHKWVKFSQEALYWGKTFQQIEQSNTKHKIKEITGILYGKCTARHQQNNESAELMFSFILKDRTVDFTIKNVKDKDKMFQFILGAAWNIDSFHERQLKIQREKLSPKQKLDEDMNDKIRYRKYKNQSMTKGKLLWKNLFISLGSKNVKTNKEILPKAKNLYECSSLTSELGMSAIQVLQARSGIK